VVLLQVHFMRRVNSVVIAAETVERRGIHVSVPSESVATASCSVAFRIED
jgi:hypothetical protein